AYPVRECPHRLSDKLLKSGATLASRGGVYYAFPFQSQPLFQKFFSGDSELLNRSTPRGVSRCAVSMEAHYRDPNSLHKPFFDLFYQLLTFHSFRWDLMRSA
ncbi:MAG: hypothetical protein ABN478_09075, partial [Mixta sp.]